MAYGAGAQIAVAVAETYPKLSLAQLLAGYDKDVHRSEWPDDGPIGKESL